VSTLATSPVFRALTQPQMFAGVTYPFFVINLVVTTEAFLISRSPWSLLTAVILHLTGYVICLYDPRLIDVWIKNVSLCGRIKNRAFWRCNSYSP